MRSDHRAYFGSVEVEFFEPRIVNVWLWQRPRQSIVDVPMVEFRDDLLAFSRSLGHYESLPPPSETLLSLLRHFHEHRAVAPLLDRLIEEYPDLEPYLAGVCCGC